MASNMVDDMVNDTIVNCEAQPEAVSSSCPGRCGHMRKSYSDEVRMLDVGMP